MRRADRQALDRHVAAILELTAQMTISRLTLAQVDQFHLELAEIRDGLVDLDHAKAPVAQLRELHSRVDDLEHQNVHNFPDAA